METKKPTTKKNLTVEEVLAAEEKVHIYLPSTKYGVVWEGSINGCPIVLGTDQDLMVPKSVAEHIKNNDDLRKKSAEDFRKYGGKGFKMREFEE